jgi:serine/threonine protein kinase/tetratricopeptide (TPR) repeat protein
MSAAMSQAHPVPGQVISHYKIVEKIGAGGMGVVYRAHDEQLDRDVALKVLPAGLLAEDAARKQFRKEALALAKLNHPNIETIYEFSSDGGMDFLAMELIRGEPMDQMLDKGPLGEGELVRLATQFAEGLAAAHEQGVIHRDLKPANLFVTPDGRIKILDFGLAKLFHPELTVDATRSVTIETGSISGTVPYMSPEQLRGLPVDVRSDIYAAGAVLFEMATGKRPYPQMQTAELMGAILLQPLPPPSSVNPNISPKLERIISKSLQKAPADRFQSARELRAALMGMNSAPTIANMPIPDLATMKLQPVPSTGSGIVSAPSSAANIPGPASVSASSGRPWMIIFGIAVLAVIAAGSILLGLNFHGMRDRIFKSRSGGGVSQVQPPAQPQTGEASPQQPSNDGQPHATPQPENPKSPPVVPLASSKTRRPVAVIGFKNVSGAADAAWLSTAFSEALTSDLAGGGKLLAIPTDTVAQMKTNLTLSDADSYSKDKLARIHENLGADKVVIGSYQTVGKSEVKLDLKLTDPNSGEIVASASGTGKQADLSELVARTGSTLREKLGVGVMTGAETSIAKASLPSNAQAAMHYSEGLAKLRAFDYSGARDVLQTAVAEEPGFPFGHAALADAWESLGNETKVRDESNQAFRLAGGLGQDDKLLLEARYHATIREYDKAVQIYLGLFGSSPDNVEYGLKLARAQIRAGRAQDALATMELLRRAPTASGGDPRIDEMQAYAAQWTGDYKTEHTAATRAAEKAQAEGARLVQAAALLDQSFALRAQGQVKEAIAAAEEAQRIYSSAGDRLHVAAAVHSQGAALEQEGASEPARMKYQEARQLDDEIGNREAAADEYSSIARVFASHGFLAAAQKILEQTVANYRISGNEESASTALASLGDVLFRRGDLKNAQDKYDESMGIVRNTGDVAAQGRDLVGTSRVLYMQGDLAGAMKSLDAAAPVAQKLGDKVLSGMISSCKGDIFLAGGELAEARKAYEASVGSFQDSGDKRNITGAQVELARLTIEEGQPANAEAPLRQAIEEFAAEKNPTGETIARALLASALLATRLAPAEAEAQKEMNAAIPYVASLQDPRPRLALTIAAARVATAISGDPAQPRKLLDGALADATRDGLVPYQFEARFALAEILMKVGKSGQGRFQLAALEKDATAKGFLLIAKKSHAAAGHN